LSDSFFLLSCCNYFYYYFLLSLCIVFVVIKNRSIAMNKVVVFALILLAHQVTAGPIAYGICQSGCAALVVSCYSAAGAVFGTVTVGVGVAPAILACNTAFGACSAKCAAIGLLAPTP
jgi:hypothetical protein